MDTDLEWFKRPQAAHKSQIEDLEESILELRQELKQADRLRKNMIYNKIANREQVINYLNDQLNRKKDHRSNQNESNCNEAQAESVHVLRGNDIGGTCTEDYQLNAHESEASI